MALGEAFLFEMSVFYPLFYFYKQNMQKTLLEKATAHTDALPMLPG